MAKTMRQFPDLLIMLKGIVKGIRAVTSATVVLFVFTYVFAITFVSLAKDTPMLEEGEEDVFQNVREAILRLTCESLFPDNSPLIYALLERNIALAFLCIFFFFLTSFTIMNMVVGMMCEVVADVARDSNESATFAELADKLKELYAEIDDNTDGQLSQHEMQHILENDGMLTLLQRIGVDVYALVDDIGSIFAGLSIERLSFDGFAEVVWQYRPTNAATIRCVSSFRYVAFAKLCDLEDRFISFEQLLGGVLDAQGYDFPENSGSKPLENSHHSQSCASPNGV